MKTMRICITLLGVFVFANTVFSQNAGEQFVKDELLVKVRKGQNSSAVGDVHGRIGSTLIERLGDLGWQRVKLNGGTDIKSATSEYLRSPEIEAAQPNYYYHLLAIPNDPQFPLAGMYGLTKISAPQAWDLTTGSPTVVVANIDTGMRYTHEDLAANMWANPGEINGNGVDDDNNGFADDYYGYDFYFNDSNPIDEHGHGTHTGGTIGAAGNNGLGVTGVNWNVRVMAIKIYDSDGFGTTAAMLINAYNYIRMMKNRGINIRVTNNSYSGCDEACGYDQATKDALDAMGDAGILNVFAAGNSGWNNDTVVAPAFPATYTSPRIMSVAASTNIDTRSGFSNYGSVSVDLAAPGSGILSTRNASASNYGNMSCTSTAAPHVSGAAALLSAHNPSLSAASLKATLMNTVDPLTGWATTPIKTMGRLNVFNALQNQTVCNFGLSAASITAITKGGYYSINVTAPQNCDYSVRSNANWIKLDGSASLSGNGSVSFQIGVNPTISRSATITVAGQTVSINQSRN